jgi:2-hydroxychromene-2-carboxylate isomerase
LLLSSFSVAVSAILAFISFSRIDSLCLFCMTSYAISLALLVVAVLATRSARGQSVGFLGLDVKAAIARPRLIIPLALAGLVTVVLLQILVPPYWRTPGWADLPSLASGSDEHGHNWMGAEKPALTIIEFSDYECPHCRAAHKHVRLMAGKLADRVRLVHRHLPLDMACHPGIGRPFHARACLFAEAAECAGLQGRFWEMNDALFSMQERVKAKDMDPVDLAVRLGLDRGRFKRCLEGHETLPRVQADLRESMERGLDGTPTFIVGEKVFLGRLSEPDLAGLLRGSP